MATFKITTIDGKEITVEYEQADTVTKLANLLSRNQIEGTEIVSAPGRDAKRGPIAIFGHGVIAIRPA
jgi:hypothetical protein